jgi:cobyrinic acid a,c-diamide synthase
MGSFKTPRILISSVASQAGKSLLALGLAVELRRRSQSVSVVVTGPSLATASIFYRVTRRYCRCLDARLLSSAQMRFALDQASIGADILIIDGHDGLYDGRLSGIPLASDSGMASWSKTPVVLVVDGAHFEASISPLVRGFWAAAESFPFAGVVVNRVKGENGEGSTTAESFERALMHDELPCFTGSIPFMNNKVELPSGLPFQKRNLTLLPRQFFLEAADYVKDFVKIDSILAAAAEAAPIPGNSQVDRLGRRCKIGVADESCFNLCVQDNLELLRYYGAELVAFSPLADSDVPSKVGGLYFTGAFVYEYASELSANKAFRDSVKEFAESGGVIYSEGSATAFLCENFSIPGKGVFDGVGIIPGFAEAQDPRFSYIQMSFVEDTILGNREAFIKGFHTREWNLVPNPGLKCSVAIKDDSGASEEEGFVSYPRVFATFALPHFGSNPALAKQFVDEVTMFRGL